MAVLVEPGATSYDIAVHGPNGFKRRFAGRAVTGAVEAIVKIVRYVPWLELCNTSGHVADVRISHDRHTDTVALATGTDERRVPMHDGWYDIEVRLANDPSFVRKFSGHVENGLPSVTG